MNASIYIIRKIERRKLFMNKKNICVIFGGVSSEHTVSLVSATTVIGSLNPEKYNIHMIGITLGGEWKYFNDSVDEVVNFDKNSEKYPKAIISPDRSDHGIIVFGGDRPETIKIDAAIPALHGKNGEDGTIQGLFELGGIPYVGSGVIGSAVCMDKCVAKILFRAADIPQANWVEVKADSNGNYDSAKLDEIEQKLGYPCFIKPSNAGSSVGISKAANREGLIKGLETAIPHDRKILVEEAINAREVESAVLGNDDPVCAPVLGEILPAAEFYDYDAKYADENSKLIMPAPLDDEMTAQIREYAVRAYKICECKGLSRVDFFVDRDSNRILLNEINTLPGFTSISMYPKLWDKSGTNIGELLDKLIGCALNR